MEKKKQWLCKKCAEKKGLKPIAGGFIMCEPCDECRSFGTQHTDFLVEK